MFNTSLWPADDAHDPRRVHRDRVLTSPACTRWRCCAVAADRYHRLGLLIPFVVGGVVPLQIVVGDWAARHVAEHQPVKLAAMEGLTDRNRAPRSTSAASTSTASCASASRSRRACRSSCTARPDAVVTGLESVPPRPTARRSTSCTCRSTLMVASASACSPWPLASPGLAPTPRPPAIALVPARGAPCPGRPPSSRSRPAGSTTEVGRQPWIVYGVHAHRATR